MTSAYVMRGNGIGSSIPRTARTTATEIGMASRAIELDPITVVVRSPFLEMSGVYDRMEAGSASRIITRQEIEQRPSQRLSDSFQGTPGLRVLPDGKRSVLMGRGNCQLRVYVDGVQLQGDAPDGSLDIDQIPPEWVEIAEIYPGLASVPIQFAKPPNRASPQRGCGVALIWTRRGAG